MNLNIVTLCDEIPDEKVQYAEPIDLIFCLGDIEDYWLSQRITELKPAFGVLGIKGNHDSAGSLIHSRADISFQQQTIDLRGKSLTFFGIPGSWKYKPFGHWLYTQEEMQEKLTSIPRVDFVLSHNSPANIGHERRGETMPDGVHQGFQALTDYIASHQPKFLFHGHQHARKISHIVGTTVVGCFGEELHSISI